MNPKFSFFKFVGMIDKYISELAEQHDRWTSFSKSIGAGSFAEDCVQNAYIKLTEYHQRNPENKLTVGLMFFAVRSCTIDHIRTIQQFDEIDTVEDRPDDYDHSEDEKIQQIIDVIKTFNWFDKRIMEIYFNIGMKRQKKMSMRDIAKETGISLSTIFNTIKKCKERLKESPVLKD